MDTTLQFLSILSFVITGIFVSFLHDIYRAFINALKIKGIIYAVFEMIFAFLVFVLVSTVIVYLTSGVIRPIYLVSIGVGVAFYYLLCGKKMQRRFRGVILLLKRAVLKFISFIVRICYLIGRLITYPIELIFKITTCIANGFTCIMKIRR